MPHLCLPGLINLELFYLQRKLKSTSYFFLSRGLNTQDKEAKCLPEQKRVSCWWASSQRTLKGLRWRDERMTWQESCTLIHMVWVNNSLFRCHKSTMQPALVHMGCECSTFTKREIEEGTRWGLKLWERLFYCSYKIHCAFFGVSCISAIGPLIWCVSLLASSAGGLLSICPRTTSYLHIFHVLVQRCQWQIKDKWDNCLEKLRPTLKMTDSARLKKISVPSVNP